MNRIKLEGDRHYVEIQDDGVVLVYTNEMLTNCVTNSMAEVLKAFVKELQEAREQITRLKEEYEDFDVEWANR